MTGNKTTHASEAAHHRVGSNVLFNWLGYGVNLFVAFLISPFLVHNLGDIGYGIWAMSLQLVGSMSILDLGLRIAVTRYLTHHHTRDERDEISTVFAAAFTVLSCAGVLIAVASAAFARFVTSFVDIPDQLAGDARWTVFVIGLTLTCTLPGVLFRGALAALSRYDLLNLTDIVNVVSRTVLWVVVIKQGHGILAVAVVRLLCELFVLLLQAALAWRLYGGFRLFAGLQEMKPCLPTLFTFSAYSFLLNVAQRLNLYSDRLVAGVLLGPAAVTFYSIGISLVEHLRGLLHSSTSVLVPLSTSLNAKDDRQALRNLLLRSSRLNFLLLLPALVGFFVLGKPFIRLWMGPQYADPSSTVLVLLTVPLVFAPMRVTCHQTLYGIGRHRFNAFASLFEALANLGLSVFLAWKIGLSGIAWGSLIPGVVQAFVIPIYTARHFDVRWSHYYWESLLKPALKAAPFAVFLIVFRWSGLTDSWVGFFGGVLCGLLIYVLLVWHFVLSGEERQEIGKKLARFVPLPAFRAT